MKKGSAGVVRVRAATVQGPRVNLTLTPELDVVLGRIASATSTGKASVVREMLLSSLGSLEGMALALEQARDRNVDAFSTLSRVTREAVETGEQIQLELGKAKRRAMRKKRAP